MKQIQISSNIIIKKDRQTVFEYLSHYPHDTVWRDEIKHIEMSTPMVEVGTRITETAYLSPKVPAHQNLLKCIDFQRNATITSETIAESMFWQKNTRSVESLPDGTTKVTYSIAFDTQIVRYGIGFGLPAFILSFYTKQTMKKYLKVLKRTLEK